MRAILPLVFVLLSGSAALAQPATLHCGRLVDVRALTIREAHTIVVENDRIVSVQAGYAQAGAGSPVVDLRNHTCMPGLIDLHVHLSTEQTPNRTVERFTLNPPDFAFRSVVYADRTLKAGFTTVRDLGNSVGTSLRAAINQGLIPGPRIFQAGNISSTGGHGDPTNGWRSDIMGDPGPDMGVINNPEDARKAVRQRYKDGADLIKITATGGVLSLAPNGDGPQMTEEEIRAIVETGRDYGFHVAAHAHGAEGIKRAVRAGVRTIEHGTLMDDEAIALMKQHGTYFVPTISAGEFVSDKAKIDGFFPPMVQVKAATIGPKLKSTFARAYAAGVPIAFGTDAGVPNHGDNGREFEYMVEAGMPPLEAIRSATLTAAIVLGAEDRLGIIEPGKLADIIAVPGNPEADIAVMRQVSFVMKGGKVHVKP